MKNVLFWEETDQNKILSLLPTNLGNTNPNFEKEITQIINLRKTTDSSLLNREDRVINKGNIHSVKGMEGWELWANVSSRSTSRL